MTSYWQNKLKSHDKYGTYVTKHQWMWYENWIPIMEKYCQEVESTINKNSKNEYLPNQIVTIMNSKGYTRFTVWWLTNLWQDDLGIDKTNTEYGRFGEYGRFYWSETFLPLVEEYCNKNISRLK